MHHIFCNPAMQKLIAIMLKIIAIIHMKSSFFTLSLNRLCFKPAKGLVFHWWGLEISEINLKKHETLPSTYRREKLRQSYYIFNIVKVETYVKKLPKLVNWTATHTFLQTKSLWAKFSENHCVSTTLLCRESLKSQQEVPR